MKINLVCGARDGEIVYADDVSCYRSLGGESFKRGPGGARSETEMYMVPDEMSDEEGLRHLKHAWTTLGR